MILVALAGVAIFLTLEGMPALQAAPSAAMGGKDNIVLYVWPLLFGTLLAAVLAMLIAAPLAIGRGPGHLALRAAPRWPSRSAT